MKRYFSEKAILQIREAIHETGGNEVFFLGRTDENRVVVEAEPLARGNRDAVAAILIAASFGDVVIHNHPSGVINPSPADLDVASILGNQGVGFYIIDNLAARCYQAVAPFARTTLERIAYPEIERIFSPEGVLARGLKGYEHREEQTRMAFAVSEAFNEGKVAIIEAGTGTGKSLAYLIPSILWAVGNRERVVISTNTINLQEQLTKKDIPFLQKHGGVEFRAVLVKGRSNYICLRRVEGIRMEPSLFRDDASDELKAIIEWSTRTSDGCRGDLSFIPRDEVWEEVCCEADQCGRVKCPHYARCFFYTARREAAGADLLVVNHALLMADVMVRQETGYSSTAVLPPFERLIFDEGHHLEDVATASLSTQISRQGLLKHLGRLQNPRKAQQGLLPALSNLLSRSVPESLDDLYLETAAILESSLIPKRNTLYGAVTQTMDAIATALASHMKGGGKKDGEQKLRVTLSLYNTSFWREVEERVRELTVGMTDYIGAMQSLFQVCERFPDKVLEMLAGVLTDLKGIMGRLERAVENLYFFISREEGFCRWFEISKGGKGTSVKLCSAPLEVNGLIKSVILDKFRTIVITSATLAVGDRFSYLEERTGISLLDRARVTELQLSSPFDYRKQAFVGIPSDIPEPTAPGFERMLGDYILEGLTISQGRAFVLFTSYDLLTKLFDRLREPLKGLGLTHMRQGETNRHLLLSRFRKERNAVLFGTDSFWEGVDVQGKALELVVITRLPFRVPTEPILEARAEHIEAGGLDPFMEYTIPQAVLKFKQGVGRLIRSKDDRGGILILDSRVLSKNYGRYFLRSLPDARLVKGDGAEVFAAMRPFFKSFAATAGKRGKVRTSKSDNRGRT